MGRIGRFLRRNHAVVALWVILALLGAGCSAPAETTPSLAPSLTPGQPTALAIVTNPAPPTTTALPTLLPSSTPTQWPTETATNTLLPTVTPTHTASPSPAAPTPTVTPSPSATPRRSTATPTRPPPTATLPPYLFLPAGPAWPDPSHPCPGCPLAPAYIVGHVLDAAGTPLAGVRLVCYNKWHRYPVVASKGGGEYDFAVVQARTTWYVVVLDDADRPVGPEVAVPFEPAETCRYILYWARVK